MKHPHLLDKALVAALLLAYVPEPTPSALILPVPEAPSTEDNPAERL